MAALLSSGSERPWLRATMPVKQVSFAPRHAIVEVYVYDLSIGLARAVSECVVGAAFSR